MAKITRGYVIRANNRIPKLRFRQLYILKLDEICTDDLLPHRPNSNLNLCFVWGLRYAT